MGTIGRTGEIRIAPGRPAQRVHSDAGRRRERSPALVILRIVDDDVATFDIHDWLRNQPEPLGGVPFLMIADAVIDEAQATLDVWIERAIRTLLEEAAVSDTKS